MKTREQHSSGQGKKIGIIISQFNEFITKRLLRGCLDELSSRGVRKNSITVVWVPGSYEIPLIALKLAKKKSIHAVICLGSIIRGETIHFDLVAHNTARGIAQASLLTGKPVIFGVLATETVEQAYKRSQEKGENKGRDAALAALKMVNLLSKL